MLDFSICNIVPSAFWHSAFCVLPCMLCRLHPLNLHTFQSCTECLAPDLSKLDKANFVTKFRSEFQARFLMGNLILPILNFRATTSDMTFIPVSNSSMAIVHTVFKGCCSPSLSVWCYKGLQDWS